MSTAMRSAASDRKFLPSEPGYYGLSRFVADPKLKPKAEDDIHVESDKEVGDDDKGVGEEEEKIQKVMTEQEVEEGKRMFSMFAARMFQQRVLQTYREKVAQERQQQLLRELEDEGRLRKEQMAKKRMRKQKQRQRKLAKKEERTARAAKKAAETQAAMEAKQRVHEEEMRLGNEEERPEHAVARKAAEEEKRCEGGKRIQSMFPGDMRMHITQDGEFAVALGGFADIYRGTIHVQHTEIKVAIKTIKVYSAEDDYLKKEKRLQREVQVWMKLNHANVLSLYGTTSGFGPLPSMVCPWLENGTLTSYLERCCANLELQHVLALVHDVASGLQYLHSQSIVHGDLSGSNVLIHANGRACISDFGLSMVLDEIRRSTSATTAGKPRGTLRWAAPELLDLVDHGDAEAQHTRPTMQSDIYAFGSIMLQILSGKVPYYYYSRDLQIVAAIFRGEMPMRPDNPRVTDRRWEFIQRCWSPFRIAVQRPSSEEIVAFSTDMVSLGAAL